MSSPLSPSPSGISGRASRSRAITFLSPLHSLSDEMTGLTAASNSRLRSLLTGWFLRRRTIGILIERDATVSGILPMPAKAFGPKTAKSLRS
jgi:hypothetical protein